MVNVIASISICSLRHTNVCVCLCVSVCLSVSVCVCVCVCVHEYECRDGLIRLPSGAAVASNNQWVGHFGQPRALTIPPLQDIFQLQTILPLVWDPGLNGRTSINVSISCRPLNGGQGPIRSQIMPAPLIDGSPLRGKPVRSLGGGHPQTQTHSFTSRLRRSPNATQLVAV